MKMMLCLDTLPVQATYTLLPQSPVTPTKTFQNQLQIENMLLFSTINLHNWYIYLESTDFTAFNDNLKIWDFLNSLKCFEL